MKWEISRWINGIAILAWLAVLVLNLILLLDTDKNIDHDTDRALLITTLVLSVALVLVPMLRVSLKGVSIKYHLFNGLLPQIEAPILGIIVSAVIIHNNIECKPEAVNDPVHCVVRYSSAAAIVGAFTSLFAQASSFYLRYKPQSAVLPQPISQSGVVRQAAKIQEQLHVADKKQAIQAKMANDDPTLEKMLTTDVRF